MNARRHACHSRALIHRAGSGMLALLFGNVHSMRTGRFSRPVHRVSAGQCTFVLVLLQMSESIILAIRNSGCHYGSVLGGDRLDMRILTQSPQILVANRSVDLGSPKARLILAVLAESVGRVVPTTTLIDHVWNQNPPDSVRATLQSYFSRMRSALREAGAQARIVHRGQGYVLETVPEFVDWHRVRQWSDQARKLIRRGQNDRAVVLLEDALALWQGEPLTEFSGPWADSLRRGMARTHTRILGYWAGARIELGQHDEVLDRLDDHPLNETLTLHHMSALAARAKRVPDRLEAKRLEQALQGRRADGTGQP